MFRYQQKSRLRNAIAAASVLVLAGCGQDQVSNPMADSFAGRPIQLPASERFGMSLQDLPSVTQVISASGGTMTMGRYTLTFPAGALTHDTPITITQTDPSAMVLELQPHGIQFKKPVLLSAQVTDLVSPGSQSIGVAWLNESTNTWEPISHQSSSSSVASAELWHFSHYEFFDE